MGAARACSASLPIAALEWLEEKPRLHNVPTPSFGALDGVYCTGDETRTADDYYSLQDPLGSVVFAAGVSTNEGEGGGKT
jgi:hypothetical protein